MRGGIEHVADQQAGLPLAGELGGTVERAVAARGKVGRQQQAGGEWCRVGAVDVVMAFSRV